MRAQWGMVAIVLVFVPGQAVGGTESEPEIRDALDDVSPPIPFSEKLDILGAWVENLNRTHFRITLAVAQILDTSPQAEYAVTWRNAAMFTELDWKRPLGVQATGNGIGLSYDYLCAYRNADGSETPLAVCNEPPYAPLKGEIRAGSPGYITWTSPRYWAAGTFEHGVRLESFAATSADRSPTGEPLNVGDSADGGSASFDFVDFGFTAFETFVPPAGAPPLGDDSGDANPGVLDLTGFWPIAEPGRLEFLFRLREFNRTADPECYFKIEGVLEGRGPRANRVEASLRVELGPGVPSRETRASFTRIAEWNQTGPGSYSARFETENGTASAVEGKPGWIRLRFDNPSAWSGGAFNEHRHEARASTDCLNDSGDSDSITAFGNDLIPGPSVAVAVLTALAALVSRRRGR